MCGFCSKLAEKFAQCLKDGAAVCASPLVVIVDGLDLLESAHQARLLEWIPGDLPKVITCCLLIVEINSDTKSKMATIWD